MDIGKVKMRPTTVGEFIDSIIERLCNRISGHYHDPANNMSVRWNDEVQIFELLVKGSDVNCDTLAVFEEEWKNTKTELTCIMFEVGENGDMYVVFQLQLRAPLGEI